MIQILGVLDLLSAGLLVASVYNLPIAKGLIIGMAVYLLLKSLLFIMDIGSLFDAIGGILLILALFITIPPILLFISAGLIAVKGVMSLFAG